MNAKFINYFLAIFVIAVCFIWVYFLIFSDEFLGGLPNTQRNIFIGLLLLYGSYRSFRLYQQIKRDNANSKFNEDEE